MNKVISFFKLIRLPNLLMIGLVQYVSADLIRWSDRLPLDDFYLVVVLTVLVALGGYLINDYFDYDIDKLNGKTRLFSRQFVLIFSIISFAIATSISVISFKFICSFHFIIPIVLLIVYAKYLSKYKIMGNVLIAMLVAYAILIVPLTHWMLTAPHRFGYEHGFSLMACAVFASFAFLFIWIREVVKDIEDYKGDLAFGRKTWGTILGEEKARKIPLFTVLFISLFGVVLLLLNEFYILALGIFTVGGVLLCLLYRAKEKKDYTRISLLLKIIMLIGVLSPLFL